MFMTAGVIDKITTRNVNYLQIGLINVTKQVTGPVNKRNHTKVTTLLMEIIHVPCQYD